MFSLHQVRRESTAEKTDFMAIFPLREGCGLDPAGDAPVRALAGERGPWGVSWVGENHPEKKKGSAYDSSGRSEDEKKT